MNTLRTRPWALLFFISLAVNLFLGGVGVARWVHRRNMMNTPHSMGSAMPAREMGPGARAFDERLRGSHGTEFETRMKAVQEARGKVRATLKKEPFDENAANLAFSELRDKTSSLQQLVHQTMLETARDLSPQERAHLARALERGPGQWMGRMGGPQLMPSASAVSSSEPNP